MGKVPIYITLLLYSPPNIYQFSVFGKLVEFLGKQFPILGCFWGSGFWLLGRVSSRVFRFLKNADFLGSSSAFFRETLRFLGRTFESISFLFNTPPKNECFLGKITIFEKIRYMIIDWASFLGFLLKNSKGKRKENLRYETCEFQRKMRKEGTEEVQ